MALSRVKTWTAEVLTASDLNAEFNNIINNALSLISPLTGDLDIDNNRLDDISAGSVTDPSINPNGDSNTGIYFSGADTVDVTTGGVLAAEFGAQAIIAAAPEDSRTDTVDIACVLRSTTSGTPDAGIGTGLQFDAESANENPSILGSLQFLFTDKGAGAEDSDFLVFLREAGATAAERFRIASDGTTTITGAQLIVSETDSRTNAVDTAAIIRSVTSGTPAAGIGTGLQFDAESADENPCVLGSLNFAASDVGAGSEDTYVDLLLRVAGRTAETKYRFASTAGSGFQGTFTHAASADRTWTLPDETGTLSVGGGMSNANGAQGINNIDAADEEIQRAQAIDDTAGSADVAMYELSASVTFGEAFSAIPVVVTGGCSNTGGQVVSPGAVAVSTSGFTISGFTSAQSASITNMSSIALGD